MGIGMCPEAIEQNPVVYELTSDMAFRFNIIYNNIFFANILC